MGDTPYLLDEPAMPEPVRNFIELHSYEVEWEPEVRSAWASWHVTKPNGADTHLVVRAADDIGHLQTLSWLEQLRRLEDGSP